MLYFEDLHTGMSGAFNYRYKVTEEEVMEVGRRWDPMPFHVDKAAAEQSMFGGLVASSVHIFAMFVRCGMDEGDADLRISAATALGFDKLQWHAPVRPGDELRLEFEIGQLRDSAKHPHLGVVTIHNRLLNQRDELVFSLECTFMANRHAQNA